MEGLMWPLLKVLPLFGQYYDNHYHHQHRVKLRTMNEKTVDTLAGEKWSVEAETLWTRLGEDDENDVSDGDDDNNADYNDDGNYQTWRGWCWWWIYLIQHKPNLRQEQSCHQVSSTQTCGVRTSARVRTKGQKLSWNEYHWMGGKALRHQAKLYLNLHKFILLVSRSSPSPASPDTQLCSSTTQSSFPQVEIIFFNIIIVIVFARWSRMKRNNRSGVVSCAATWPPGSTTGSPPNNN